MCAARYERARRDEAAGAGVQILKNLNRECARSGVAPAVGLFDGSLFSATTKPGEADCRGDEALRAGRLGERFRGYGQLATGVQVPGEVWSLQLTQVPSQEVSQQTLSAPHTPLAHSSVMAQVVPGIFLRWQAPDPSQ